LANTALNTDLFPHQQSTLRPAKDTQHESRGDLMMTLFRSTIVLTLCRSGASREKGDTLEQSGLAPLLQFGFGSMHNSTFRRAQQYNDLDFSRLSYSNHPKRSPHEPIQHH
jgi:hypothetical protein